MLSALRKRAGRNVAPSILIAKSSGLVVVDAEDQTRFKRARFEIDTKKEGVACYLRFPSCPSAAALISKALHPSTLAWCNGQTAMPGSCIRLTSVLKDGILTFR